jgi:hypothetical protein
MSRDTRGVVALKISAELTPNIFFPFGLLYLMCYYLTTTTTTTTITTVL